MRTVTLPADDLEELLRRSYGSCNPDDLDDEERQIESRARTAIAEARAHPEQEVTILAPPEITEFPPREEELKAFFAHPACREVMQDFLRAVVLSALSPIITSIDNDHPDIVWFAERIVRNDEWYDGLIARFTIE